MSNNYFSPNQKISGGAMFATWNSKDGHIYLRLLKQIAMNADKKGNFDGQNPLNLKLSQDEVADIVRAVRTNGEVKFFHKFDQNTTSGIFKYYLIKSTETGKPDRSGFGLSVKKTADGKVQEVKMGFTHGAAERFSLFLQNALRHIFDAEYSQDLRDAKEYSKKNKEEKPKQDSVIDDLDLGPEEQEEF